MKKLFYLLIIISFSKSFAQTTKEKLIIQGDMLIAKDTIYFTIIDYNKDSIYVVDFGDGNNSLLDKNALLKTKVPNVFTHVYSQSKDYISTLSKFNNDTSKELLSTCQVSIKKERKNLHITKITFKDYYPIKKDGRAWDNMISGTYPDVYLIINNQNNETYLNNSDRRYENVAKNTPVSWAFDNLVLKKDDFKKTIQFMFYDNDSISDHDFLGGNAINEASLSKIFTEDKGVKLFDNMSKNGCVYEIEYFWE